MILNQPSEKWIRIILFVLSIILLGSRFTIVLLDFNFLVTDNDQALLWRACDDLSNGIFHTPFIYGCNYGSNLESLLAVPFYKLGMPLYYALPFSNAFWVLLISIVLGYNLNVVFDKTQSGTIFILLLALMPTELYALLFAAKGHMAGILLAMMAMAITVRYTSLRALILIGFLTGLALQLNPNSLFLTLLICLFVTKFKNASFIGIGALLSLSYMFITSYYSNILNSEFLHKQWEIEFSFDYIIKNSDNFDKYLNAVTPFGDSIGFLSLAIPLILASVLFYKKQWIVGSLALSFFIVLLFSFGVNKVLDGSNDILFHFSRFYLAIAFCNAILVMLVLTHIVCSKYVVKLISAGMFVVIVFLINTSSETKRISDECGTTYAVRKSLVSDVKKQSDWMIAELTKMKLSNPQIVVTDHLLYTEGQYLSTLHLPNVISCNTKYKSFYWMEAELNSLHKSYDIFFISLDKGFEKKGKTHQSCFHSDSMNSYFLICDVKQPAEYIAEFIN